MGYYAGHNVHQLMLSECLQSEPQFLKLQDPPAVIGLAVGHNAVSYSSAEGTQHGRHMLDMLFGNDMGYSSMWSDRFYDASLLTERSLLELYATVRALQGLAMYQACLCRHWDCVLKSTYDKASLAGQ
jgi:hypothetical protein